MGKKVTSTVGSKDIKVSRELLFLVRPTDRKPLVGCVKTPRDVETNGKDVVSSRFSTFFFLFFSSPNPTIVGTKGVVVVCRQTSKSEVFGELMVRLRGTEFFLYVCHMYSYDSYFKLLIRQLRIRVQYTTYRKRVSL